MPPRQRNKANQGYELSKRSAERWRDEYVKKKSLLVEKVDKNGQPLSADDGVRLVGRLQHIHLHISDYIQAANTAGQALGRRLMTRQELHADFATPFAELQLGGAALAAAPVLAAAPAVAEAAAPAAAPAAAQAAAQAAAPAAAPAEPPAAASAAAQAVVHAAVAVPLAAGLPAAAAVPVADEWVPKALSLPKKMRNNGKRFCDVLRTSFDLPPTSSGRKRTAPNLGIDPPVHECKKAREMGSEVDLADNFFVGGGAVVRVGTVVAVYFQAEGGYFFGEVLQVDVKRQRGNHVYDGACVQYEDGNRQWIQDSVLQASVINMDVLQVSEHAVRLQEIKKYAGLTNEEFEVFVLRDEHAWEVDLFYK